MQNNKNPSRNKIIDNLTKQIKLPPGSLSGNSAQITQNKYLLPTGPVAVNPNTPAITNQVYDSMASGSFSKTYANVNSNCFYVQQDGTYQNGLIPVLPRHF